MREKRVIPSKSNLSLESSDWCTCKEKTVNGAQSILLTEDNLLPLQKRPDILQDLIQRKHPCDNQLPHVQQKGSFDDTDSDCLESGLSENVTCGQICQISNSDRWVSWMLATF